MIADDQRKNHLVVRAYFPNEIRLTRLADWPRRFHNTPAWRHCLCLHGLAPFKRGSFCRACRVFRAQEHLCLGEDRLASASVIRCTIGAASLSGRLFNATTFALAGRIAENPSITSRLHNVIDAMANKSFSDQPRLLAGIPQYHNFVKISGAHRMTPAQAAGVDSRCWEMSDIVAMIEAWEAALGEQ